MGVSVWLSFTLHVLNMHTQLYIELYLCDIVDNPTKVALSTLYTEALWKITFLKPTSRSAQCFEVAILNKCGSNLN